MPEDCTQGFVDLIDTRSYYRDLINLYGHSKDRGNQTSLVASTSSSKMIQTKRRLTTIKTLEMQMEKRLRFLLRSPLPTEVGKNLVLPSPARRDNVKSSKWNLKEQELRLNLQ